MFLLIDIGNTKTKWMLRDHKDVYKQDSFLTEDIDQDHFVFDVKIQKIFISNVASFEKEAILKIKLKKFLCPIEFIKPQKKCNHLLNNYQDITSLGTDRWLSALSVSHSTQKDAVIVSVGTAVTIDYLSFDKNKNVYTFEGGVIVIVELLVNATPLIIKCKGGTEVVPVVILPKANEEGTAVNLGAVIKT